MLPLSIAWPCYPCYLTFLSVVLLSRVPVVVNSSATTYESVFFKTATLRKPCASRMVTRSTYDDTTGSDAMDRTLRSATTEQNKGMGGEGAYSFVACLSHLTIDHASLSRRRRGDAVGGVFGVSVDVPVGCCLDGISY